MTRRDYEPGEGPVRGIVNGCFAVASFIFVAAVLLGVIGIAAWVANQ